eukprot:5020929-Pleurochrysis_carterae.AAC.1
MDGWHYCSNARQDSPMRSLTMLNRTHSGTRPSLPSQRPASFATRNSDSSGRKRNKRRAEVFLARL